MASVPLEETPVVAPARSTPPFARVQPVAPDEQQQTLLETVRLRSLAGHESVSDPGDGDRRAHTLAALADIQQIPALASLARGFTQTINREDASTAEIVEAVSKDPALCVRVLRMANSAAVGSAQRIEDIHSAVLMIGILPVRRIAQALFTMRDAHAVVEGFDWRHLWVHGLATAAIAEELEKQLQLPPNPRLYLAALLHDVGKIVLSTVSAEDYRALLVEAWNGRQRLEQLEASRLGVGHGEAGVIFAEHCGLGRETIEVIAHHAAPQMAAEHPLTVALVNVANFVAKTYGLGFSGARLDESDGDFETLDAWSIIRQHAGPTLNLAALEEQLRRFIEQLKPELKRMQSGG